MSSYKKLKVENQKLRQNILTLVLNPDSYEAMEIRFCVQFQADLDRLIWFGSKVK